MTTASRVNGRQASVWVVAARLVARSTRKVFRRGSSRASTIPISVVGTITSSVPERPKASTSGVTSAGPSAKPTLPPTLNRLMPLERRAPET